MNPKVILFDEPTSALDPEMIGEVTKLMREEVDFNMTMIIVSHEMNFIKDFCTRVIFLDEGKIVSLKVLGSIVTVYDLPKIRSVDTKRTNEVRTRAINFCFTVFNIA